MSKVIVIGSSNTDMVFETPKFPNKGETVVGGKFEVFSGGKGANQAVAAARAGSNVLFLTKVGDDNFGRNAINQYKNEGIETSYIQRQKGVASGTAMIMVHKKSGENSIIVAPGSNSYLDNKDVDSISRQIRKNDIVLCQLEVPIETVNYVLSLAKRKKAITILNPAPYKKINHNFLRKVDIITPNETETFALTGIKLTDNNNIEKAASYLLKVVKKAVIITLGKKGVYFTSKQIKGQFLSSSKVNVIDTTAAGDVFNGYFASELAKNKKIIDSIKMAIKAASISVTRKGAQPSIPLNSELNKL
jgi:ribokinase